MSFSFFNKVVKSWRIRKILENFCDENQNQRAQFGQLYILDSSLALEERMGNAANENCNETTRASTVSDHKFRSNDRKNWAKRSDPIT